MCTKIKGKIANKVIKSAGFAAIKSCSELAYSNVIIERVLKLNGLSINVAGSSFNISINTKK